MNRLELLHTGARADLPKSIMGFERATTARRPRLLAPLTSFYLAIVGFMGCGAAVIVTTGFIALRIQ